MPIIDIQPALKQPQNYYYAAEATAIDAQARLQCLLPYEVQCKLSTGS